MRIGITFDLKNATPLPDHVPDDYQEEFDSPATVEAIAAVLRGMGHGVVELGDGREMLQRVLAAPPDFVFNIAEGQGVGRSREARVPAVLEMLGIPYTGSDPLTLAVTLDKDCAKRLVRSAGVTVARGLVVRPDDDLRTLPKELPYTAIVKPAWEGSSKGIRGKCIAETAQELVAAVQEQRQGYRQPILVEEYIEGDELTVGVLGNDSPRVIGVMRVLPTLPEERFIYSLEVKRDWRRRVRYECPAKLPPAAYKAVEDASLMAYRALGCRDVSRVDFRLRDGVPYFLEVNPLPGLNPETGDLVILAGLVGMSHAQLISEILDAAMRRQGVSAITKSLPNGRGSDK
jgi:D-alanine-D-alanine ligase